MACVGGDDSDDDLEGADYLYYDDDDLEGASYHDDDD